MPRLTEGFVTDEADPLLEVSRNLRAIVDLSALLHDQAANRASHHDMPGGAATVCLGPVASPIDRERRGELIEADWLRRRGEDWCEEHETIQAQCAHRLNPWTDEDAIWEPPLQTLLFWSEAWRNEHGAEDNQAPTVTSEAGWLSGILQWAYDNEPHWDDFAADMEAARCRLEALLYAGEREERSRVPCIDCELDREGNRIRILLVRQYAHDPRGDRWVCPRCKRKYDEGAFIRAQHVEGARRGTERFVTVSMAAEALDVSPRQVKAIATACDIASRSLMVYWPDARAWQRARQVAAEMTAV